MATVKFTEVAYKDLEEISTYIFKDNPEYSFRLIDGIYSTCVSASNLPESG